MSQRQSGAVSDTEPPSSQRQPQKQQQQPQDQQTKPQDQQQQHEKHVKRSDSGQVESSSPRQDSNKEQGEEEVQQPREGRSLVRALLSAAMHSRAAYGYAMKAGHLTSLMSYALMHTVHSIRHPPLALPTLQGGLSSSCPSAI